MDSEEAAVIETAARTINEKIKSFKAQYATVDDLDIVIMCCLDIMTEQLKQQAKTQQQEEAVLTALTTLEKRLDDSLQTPEEL